jgi:hypothetical protein
MIEFTLEVYAKCVEVVECSHITGLDFELTCAIFKFFCHFRIEVWKKKKEEKKNEGEKKNQLSPAGFEPAPPKEDCPPNGGT